MSALPGNGTFTQNGGTANIVGGLIIASATGSSNRIGGYVLQSGALNVTGTGIIQLNAGGSFTQNGGTLAYTTFNMVGGTVNGNAHQRRRVQLHRPARFNGRLDHSVTASATFNADFIAGNGMANATTFRHCRQPHHYYERCLA